jgi:hypothetical protein
MHQSFNKRNPFSRIDTSLKFIKAPPAKTRCPHWLKFRAGGAIITSERKGKKERKEKEKKKKGRKEKEGKTSRQQKSVDLSPR